MTPVAGSFAFTYNGSTTPPTAAGTYAVVATFTSADPSYANATVTTTETINPATPDHHRQQRPVHLRRHYPHGGDRDGRRR